MSARVEGRRWWGRIRGIRDGVPSPSRQQLRLNAWGNRVMVTPRRETTDNPFWPTSYIPLPIYFTAFVADFDLQSSLRGSSVQHDIYFCRFRNHRCRATRRERVICRTLSSFFLFLFFYRWFSFLIPLRSPWPWRQRRHAWEYTIFVKFLTKMKRRLIIYHLFVDAVHFERFRFLENWNTSYSDDTYVTLCT